MISRTIQNQVPIGSKVTFTLDGGQKVQGILVELGRDHLKIEHDGSEIAILLQRIVFWEIPKDQPTLKKEIEVSGNKDSIMPTHPHPDVIRKLLEIEAHLEAQLGVAAVGDVKAPDFKFPEDEIKGRKGTEFQSVWTRIREKYNYAAKINELSTKFGRIQPIVNELRTLAEQFPNSIGVKRLLAYFKWLMGNRRESLKLYQEVAVASKDKWDWHNAAVVALREGQEDLACYALEQLFNSIPIPDALGAWYLYVQLLKKQSNYSLLNSLKKIEGRKFSEEEGRILLETAIYFLKTTGNEELAARLAQKWLAGQAPATLAFEALSHFDDQPSETYQKLVSQLTAESKKRISGREIEHKPQGYIYTYRSERNFGFLRGIDGEKYFFHRSAISDDDLLDQIRRLVPGKQIPVVFETAQGAKGPVAIGVTLYRTIEEMFARATEYANDGDYPKAIAQVKRVLEINRDYPSAQEYYEKWREYARVSGVPRGSNPYARAKRVQLIEKDLDRAAQLLNIAISQGDNIESAVKDLAALLVQQGKPEQAIQVLIKNRRRIQDQQSIDNLLIGFYQNAGLYDQSIALLQKKLEQASTEGKKVQVLWLIANCYLRKEDYAQAERNFRTVLRSQPDNKSAQRNIAFCLIKQERYEEAQRILERILSTFPDGQAADLLEAIKQARAGQIPQIDEIVIETTLSDYSREVSKFAQFFLDRCDFQGVPPDHVQRQSFDRIDIQKLEELATTSRTIRPRDRAVFYLSAARIASLLDDEDPNKFYKYLCRSFTSRGDAIVIENRPLDAVREFYAEALNAYDGDRSRRKDEQDAVNALVRFLFSTLGQAQIPIKPKIPTIDETLETVLSRHPDRNKVFDAIAYLVFRSRFAANRILNRIYDKLSLQAMALEYLKSKGIYQGSPIKRLADFVRLWNELQRKSFDDFRSISNDLRLLVNVELTTAWIERGIERIKALVSRVFFDLDRQRLTQLQKIFETALELCKQVTFEEQERLCLQIDNRCRDLLGEIEDSPTRLSVEELYPIIEVIPNKVNTRLEELYESSIPQLTLRLPVESYLPDNTQQIEVQITVTNRMGCSPAECLELIVQEYEDTFTLNIPEIKLDSSLRGGDQQIFRVPLQIAKEAIVSKTFSLLVYAQYRTRSGEIEQTPVNNFSIRLYSEDEFEEIDNPYAAYAEGGVVGDPEMFYGREELIANVSKTIRESRTQSKCVVIFGQKRAGKSSVLYHLKNKMEHDKNLLILDLGNIGSLLDEDSTSPFLYQILWGILKKLEYAIDDKVNEGRSPIELSFPRDKEFYEHPTPLVFFKDIFERFRRSCAKSVDWQGVRPVLLIDEFSYIYSYITAGRIPETFMKNWKALLQENYFSAVLAGQDVMPKFKQRFPNEFGTTQDERVTYLKRQDAIKLIDEPIRIGGRQGESRYRERAIDRIIDLTAGSPFYIQIVCNRLVEYMNRKRAPLVTKSDVEQVKEELIRGNNALGLDKFDNLINSGDTSEGAISDEDALKVLTAIAVNSQTGPCGRHSIDCETRMAVDEILDDLVKRDVVERERGQYYSIRVGLFKEWLITHR